MIHDVDIDKNAAPRTRHEPITLPGDCLCEDLLVTEMQVSQSSPPTPVRPRWPSQSAQTPRTGAKNRSMPRNQHATHPCGPHRSSWSKHVRAPTWSVPYANTAHTVECSPARPTLSEPSTRSTARIISVSPPEMGAPSHAQRLGRATTQPQQAERGETARRTARCQSALCRREKSGLGTSVPDYVCNPFPPSTKS